MVNYRNDFLPFGERVIFYIGRLYSQVRTGEGDVPTGNYGYDNWAWCEAGTYNSEEELKADFYRIC